MQGKKNHQEKLFIQFQLSDYVPRDNFYRQLKNILDFGFLYASTSKYYGSEGQKSIDPVVFMKLMLVGYLENLNSDRRIIASSPMRMDILYFLGYNPDEELPWHSTLSRTRQLYGEQEFISLFKVVLKQCIDKGMVSGKRQAIDRVFVKANAASRAWLSVKYWKMHLFIARSWNSIKRTKIAQREMIHLTTREYQRLRLGINLLKGQTKRM